MKKVKIKTWSFFVVLLLIFCSACNPDDYDPNDEPERDYPENSKVIDDKN